MRPFRTLLVGIIAFALGIVVANRFPLSAAGQSKTSQDPPVSFTTGPDGVTFQNRTKNSVVIVGLTAQQPTGFFGGSEKTLVYPDGNPVFIIYEVSRKFFYRSTPNELGPCRPAVCLPPPPPCGAPPCKPWQPGRVWELDPMSPVQ